jgi:hypothetical protein
LPKVSKINENYDESTVYVLVKRFFLKSTNYIHDDYFPFKRQGARVKIREKSWLKQLKVAISTRGKRARRVKSTKSVKQILSTYVRFLVNSELAKNSQALQEVQH